MKKKLQLKIAFFQNQIIAQSAGAQTIISTLASQRRAGEIKVATSMALIIGSYLICWAPITAYFLFFIINGNESLKIGSSARRITGMAAVMTTHFSSTISPFIYAWRMEEVRSAIKRLFRCSQPIENTETTAVII